MSSNSEMVTRRTATKNSKGKSTRRPRLSVHALVGDLERLQAQTPLKRTPFWAQAPEPVDEPEPRRDHGTFKETELYDGSGWLTPGQLYGSMLGQQDMTSIARFLRLPDPPAEIIIDDTPANQTAKVCSKPADGSTLDQLAGRRESMRCRHEYAGGRRKWGYGPLVRFLSLRVGKPWIEVADALTTRGCDQNPEVRAHVADSLERLVAHEGSRCGGRHAQFCIDDSGVLRRWSWTPKMTETQFNGQATPTGATFELRSVSDTVRHVKLDGIWYQVKLAPLPPPHIDHSGDEPCESYSYAPRDVILGCPAANFTDEHRTRALKSTWNGAYYATVKRQLNGRELRRHGLSNG